MIRNKAKSAHASTAQTTLSMRSSRYCSTFPPLFVLCFCAVVVFLDSLTFSFYFFDTFSSLRSTKEVTAENMSLNKWKAWPMENSEDMLKIDKKLVTRKRGSRDQFLAKIIFFKTQLFHFCSSLFCLFLGCRYFFGILWLFPFISLIFFLHLGAQKK